MPSSHTLDQLDICFDDTHAIANAGLLLAATLAHNLLRWVAAIGLGARDQQVVAKTLRRTLLALPGLITRSARRLILSHRPNRTPARHKFRRGGFRLRPPGGLTSG